MIRRPFTIQFVLFLVLCAGAIPGQEDKSSATQEIVVTESNDGWAPTFSLTLAVDFTSQYLFRGILIENEDLIVQTSLDLGIGLYESEEGPINSFGLITGFFGSFHGGPTGSEGPSDDAFNEGDAYVGFSLGFFEDFEFSAVYYKYTSPNNSYEDIDEFDFSLAYDDSGFWSDIGVDIPGFEGLQPALTVAVETHDQTDAGLDEGTYLEIAIAPSFLIYGPDEGEDGDVTLTVSFPTAIGLSVDDYYEDPDLTGDDDTFGYFQTGILFTLGLGFIPEEAGAWEVHAGVQFIFLGDNAAEINVNDDFEVLFTGGFSVSF